jgi:hypothetical protein
MLSFLLICIKTAEPLGANENLGITQGISLGYFHVSMYCNPTGLTPLIFFFHLFFFFIHLFICGHIVWVISSPFPLPTPSPPPHP